MIDNHTYPVLAEFARDAYLNEAQYKVLYQRSIEDPQSFWGEQAEKFISWFSKWTSVRSGDFGNVDVTWFMNGKLNACYNCLDRHLATKKNQTAIIWEGDEPDDIRHLTYGELYEEVCRFSNVLKQQGIKKGDRVCIYLPMIPEAAVAMLACARIGAIHSVVFAGFSADALKSRIIDADVSLVITADEGFRGGKLVPIKKNVDTALKACPTVKTVIVIKRTGNKIDWKNNRDKWYHELMPTVDAVCPAEIMDANDPLFILYTSGSTGKPKGVLHSVGGYLVYVAMTHHYVFNYQADDVFWCTADVGWITGHSYTIYGPLANGATTLMYEGAPQYPSFARFWEIIDRHQVNTFYTAPTAIRALRKEGDAWVKKTSRKSLKLLGSVGEPINPEVWEWYYEIVGNGKCPVVDTWWQTETGGIMITALPGATPLKPGSAARPFFGVVPAIVNEKGEPVPNNQAGQLVIKQPWPGMMKTIYGDSQRFIDSYFNEVKNCYFTGDGAKRDEDGYYWISGRNDDVIKIAGHRLGTEELESAFLSHAAVSEAAVVTVPDDIKGNGIYAFITTKHDIEPSDALRKELIQHIRTTIGPIATPSAIQWTKDLPKTRSGKIMRRILRKIASGETEDLGDTSTLADPSVVDELTAENIKMVNTNPNK